jgi:hypothetical protein
LTVDCLNNTDATENDIRSDVEGRRKREVRQRMQVTDVTDGRRKKEEGRRKYFLHLPLSPSPSLPLSHSPLSPHGV